MEDAAHFLNVIATLSYIISCHISPSFRSTWPFRHYFQYAHPPPAFRQVPFEDDSDDETEDDLAAQPEPSIFGLPLDAYGRGSEDSDGSLQVLEQPVFDTLRRVTQITPDPDTPSILLSSHTNTLDQGDLKAVLQSLAGRPPKICFSSFDDLNFTIVDPLRIRHEDCRWTASTTTWASTEVPNYPNDPNMMLDQLECLLNMQEHLCSQPHLRYALGIAFSRVSDPSGKTGITSDFITLVRADALGTEHCPVSISGDGLGVLEIIRLALGFAIADDETLGLFPGFEFGNNYKPDFAMPVTGSKQKIVSSSRHSLDREPLVTGQKRAFPSSTGERTTFKSKRAKPDAPSKSPCREAKFFVAPDGERYYLDYLAHDRISLSGRMTRVWCAYREIKASTDLDDVHGDDQGTAVSSLANGRVFVGPYALKLENTDTSSVAWKEGLIEQISNKAKDDPEGGKYLLLPHQTYAISSISHSVRGFENIEDMATLGIPHIPRQEVVSISLYKRTLGDYTSFTEVARAIADGYRAIVWLRRQGFLHRDISDGNILLANEGPTDFTSPYFVYIDTAGQRSALLLCRRKEDHRTGVAGLLHDFDQAAAVASMPPYTLGMPDPKGTLPFISIPLLLGSRVHHTLTDDAQSLFFVLYLFPFTYGPPLQRPLYPYQGQTITPSWPGIIRSWAGGRAPIDFLSQAGAKHTFFQNDPYWNSEVLKATPPFSTCFPPQSQERADWQSMIDAIYNDHLWFTVHSTPDAAGMSFSNTYPASAVDVEDIVETLDQHAVCRIPPPERGPGKGAFQLITP